MKTGFYLRAYGCDCFMESDAKNRTKAIALEFLNKIQNHRNRFTNIDDNTIEYVKTRMLHATMEVKALKNGLRYITIDGEDFSFGCDPCVNPFEECIIV